MTEDLGRESEGATAGRRESWLAAVLAFVGVVVLFYPFLFQGYVLDANHDRREISVPFALLCRRAAEALAIPEWNPYIFNGTSALGSGAYVCMYPVNWIAFAFPERMLPWLLTGILVGHVGLAFWFAYLLLRRLGGSPFWASAAVTMYVFSSAAVMQMTAEINFTTFVYLPLVLYFMASPVGRRAGLNVVGQAVAYALMIVGGNPQLALYAIAIAGAFGADRALLAIGRGGGIDYRLLGRSAAGLGLGVMLAAPRLVPFYVSVKEAGGGRVSYEAFRSLSLTRPLDTLRFFMPEVLGASLHENFVGTLNHFETFSAYVGVGGAIMALYAVLFQWRRRTAFWNIAFIVLVLVVLGTPATRLHYVATDGAQLLYNRLAWFLPICSAVLVAVHGPHLVSGRGLRVFSVAVLVGVLATLGLLTVKLPEPLLLANRATMTSSALHFGVFFILFFAAIGVAARLGDKHLLFRALLLIPLAGDLFLVARWESNNSNSFLTPPPFFRPTPAEAEAARLVMTAGVQREQRVFRVPPDPRTHNYDKRTINNRFTYLGLYSSSGYDNYAPPRVSKLYTYPHSVSRAEERIIFPNSPRVAELTATRFVLSDEGLIRLDRALPRARLFTHVEVMPDDQALVRIVDPAFEPRQTVVLAQPPDRSISPKADAGVAEIMSDAGDRVEMRVAASVPSVLLLADTYHAGWQAEVDGARVPVLRANYAFRAVTVPAGIHVVVWRFRHPGLVMGVWLAVVAAIVCLGLGVATLCDTKRGSPRS